MLAEWLGVDVEEVRGMRRRGITADAADALCTAVGRTPGDVWPDAWYDIAWPDPDAPKRSHKKKKVDA